MQTIRNISPEEVNACWIIAERRIPYKRSVDGHPVSFLLRYDLELQEMLAIPPDDADMAEIEADLALHPPDPLPQAELRSLTRRLVRSIAAAGFR